MSDPQTLQDIDDYIADRTRDFTGRAWVFERLDGWLAAPEPRMFLLQGGPGSGKTAIAARLAQLSRGDILMPEYTRLGPELLAYYHFCRAGRDSTLHPLRFLESLSRALAARYQPFADALRKQAERSQNVSVNIESGPTVARAEAGATVVGVALDLHIGDTSARSAFDIVVRKPLEALYQSGFNQSLLILVDSLDEALTFDRDNNIVNLLESAADLPRPVRWLLTSRDDDQVHISIGDKSLDLIDDTPPGEDDVVGYAQRRLYALPEPRRSALAEQLAQAASGNFMYARYVLDDLLRDMANVVNLDTLQLPKDLEDLYRTFLKRELGRSLKEWAKEYRPLMGSLAVARGPGLRRAQLAGIIGRRSSETGDLLSACDQYLSGAQPDGPFRIYHQSFRDFLLKDEAYRVYPEEANTAIADYLLRSCGQNWDDCADDYAVQYTPIHLAEAARQLENPERHQQSERLVQLATERSYQQRITDLTALQRHLDLALRTACGDDDARAVLLIVQSVAAQLAFRREYVQPQPIFDLALAGQIADAEQRLALFGPEPRWRQAALLLIAWLAAPVNPQGARAIRDRIAAEMVTSSVLEPLLERLDAELAKSELPEGALMALPESPSWETANQIVRRMGGGQFNPSFLAEPLANPSMTERGMLLPDEDITGIDSTSGPAYIGEEEGPKLVAFVREDEVRGTALLREYINIHAANNYVYYRNMSLWGVLEAITRYPETGWAQMLSQEVMTAALTGSQLEFNEGVGIALAGLGVPPGPQPALAELLAEALERTRSQLGQLDTGRAGGTGTGSGFVSGPNWLGPPDKSSAAWGTPVRYPKLPGMPVPPPPAWGTGAGGPPAAEPNGQANRGDSWGSHARRLSALAEAYALCYKDGAQAADLVARAMRLPRGFAGYRAAAQLTLAEAHWISDANSALIQQALADALQAAHNITDPIFCVRVTARVNAIQERWPLGAGALKDLPETIAALVRDPGGAEFSAVHRIGDIYRLREANPPYKLPLPGLCYTADTLEVLARVYQQPAAEFRRLNPGLAPDKALDKDTLVNVPDAEFAPLLAARLAAELLLAPGLSQTKRVLLMQSLVPLAATNPTALDTLLARLLLAARPKDPALLQTLAEIVATTYAPTGPLPAPPAE